ARQFRARIPSDWGITSFSSLISGHEVETDLPDHDPVSWQEETIESVTGQATGNEPLSIFDFPRGPRAGSLLHKVMEDIDFTQHERENYIELIQEKLTDFGYDLAWTDAIYQMLHNVINARLESSGQGPRLCGIPMLRRLNEVEFYFPLRRISPHSLAKLFEDITLPGSLIRIPEKIGALRFSPTRGFMKGFIDMVFEWEDRYYLVDWKSNFLGASVEHYGQESLEEEMVRHLYVLQYHLYTIALDQFLRLRLPGYRYDRHFGRVYYIFLRGVSAERSPEYGIFKVRPSGAVIDRMRSQLIEMP
ncbi:MAG TPA: exodeoxyribonuclease V subunit beta, partial [Desulfobacterales bacterium]|nr:exodeoxyribonuclease V subunit beta [Desulfobacterales bacterium]